MNKTTIKVIILSLVMSFMLAGCSGMQGCSMEESSSLEPTHTPTATIEPSVSPSLEPETSPDASASSELTSSSDSSQMQENSSQAN